MTSITSDGASLLSSVPRNVHQEEEKLDIVCKILWYLHTYTPAIWSLVRYETIGKKCHVPLLNELLQQTQPTPVTLSQAEVKSNLGKETPERETVSVWGHGTCWAVRDTVFSLKSVGAV